MPFSYQNYEPTNNTTDTFNIPFDYTAESEISVTVDGVAQTGLTFPSTSTVQLTSPVASGSLVQVRRTTDLTARDVDFASGSVLTEEDLDNSNIQVFRASQEAIDKANDSIALDNDDKFDAQSKVIKNVANPVNDTDAVNKQFISTNLPNINTVAGIATDVTNVAADATDIGLVAGQISPTNNIATVAGVATEIGRLGTADAVADMNTLGTAAIVTDMDTLADIASDITTVAGKASLITSDFVSDLNTVAVTDVINDINTLATSDIVSDLNTLATTDIVSDLNTLATTDIVNDINLLATSDVVSDLNQLATSDFVSDLNTMATAQNVSDLNTVAGEISPTNNLATVAGDSADIQTVADSINDGTFAAKADSGANTDITSLTGITGGIDLNGSELILDSDADTSIHSSTDDQIDFKIGGEDRVVIDSTGSLRLKRNDLHVEPSSGEPAIFLTASTTGSSVINMGDTDDVDAGEIIYENTSNYMAFSTNGSERVRIASDGDVGIGTTNPLSTLHVNGTTYLASTTYLNGNEFFLDSDSDTSITADTDDQIDFKVGGGDRLVVTTGGATVNGNITLAALSPTLSLTGATNGYSTIELGDTANADAGEIQYQNDVNAMVFTTNASEQMRIANDGDIGIGTSSPSEKLHVAGNGRFQNTSGYSSVKIVAATNGTSTLTMGDTADDNIGQIQYNNSYNHMQFTTNNSVKMHISSGGNVGVGTTAPAQAIETYTTGSGKSIQTRNNSSSTITMGVYYGNSTVRDSAKTNQPGINFVNGAVVPAGGAMFYSIADNILDFGTSSQRWDDIYATNGTIQTSDANLKQQIAPLTDAEITAAKAISALFKTYKWNDSVAEKGDAARTHAGVVAQEVEAAMTAAGLNASDYAFFISTTWWEADVYHPAIEAADAVYDDDGNIVSEAVEAEDAVTIPETFTSADDAPEGATECNRKGIRYPELLAFIGAATEQRLTSIEARLTALEDA